MNIPLYLHFLTLSIALYISKWTQISPVYVMIIISFILFFISKSKNLKIYFSIDSLAALLLSAYLVLTNFQFYLTGEFINLLFGLLGYIIIRSDSTRLPLDGWLRLIKNMSIITVIILGIDSVIRILNPSEVTEFIANNESYWFYKYKSGSLMFQDSNTTGLVSLILFSLLQAIEYRIKCSIFSNWLKIVLVILIIISFSRAAIFSFLLFYFILLLLNSRIPKKLLYILSAVTTIVVVSAFAMFLNQIVDPSTIQKFGVFADVYKLIESASVTQFLFGFGVSTAVELIGKHPHNLFVTYQFEMGFLGLSLFLFFCGVFLYRYGIIFLFPILLSAMSFFTYLGAPYLFFPMALFANVIHFLRKGNLVST